MGIHPSPPTLMWPHELGHWCKHTTDRGAYAFDRCNLARRNCERPRRTLALPLCVRGRRGGRWLRTSSIRSMVDRSAWRASRLALSRVPAAFHFFAVQDQNTGSAQTRPGKSNLKVAWVQTAPLTKVAGGDAVRQSRDIVVCDTPNVLAMSASVSPASRRALASCCWSWLSFAGLPMCWPRACRMQCRVLGNERLPGRTHPRATVNCHGIAPTFVPNLRTQ